MSYEVTVPAFTLSSPLQYPTEDEMQRLGKAKYWPLNLAVRNVIACERVPPSGQRTAVLRLLSEFQHSKSFSRIIRKANTGNEVSAAGFLSFCVTAGYKVPRTLLVATCVDQDSPDFADYWAKAKMHVELTIKLETLKNLVASTAEGHLQREQELVRLDAEVAQLDEALTFATEKQTNAVDNLERADAFRRTLAWAEQEFLREQGENATPKALWAWMKQKHAELPNGVRKHANHDSFVYRDHDYRSHEVAYSQFTKRLRYLRSK